MPGGQEDMSSKSRTSCHTAYILAAALERANGCLGQGHDMIGGQFQTGGKCHWGGLRKLVYDTNRTAILKRDLVRLYVDGNW